VEVQGLVEGSWTLADTGRHQFPPWGVNGGSPGAPSDSLAKRPDQPSFAHVEFVRHRVPAGTTAVVVTAGGGGWGDPLGRDPARVRADVIDEYVSLAAARDRYGVVFTATTDVDVEATTQLRAKLRAARGAARS